MQSEQNAEAFEDRRLKAIALAADWGVPLREVEGRLPPQDIDVEYEALCERREAAAEEARQAERAASYATEAR